jgi:VanZ family protein
MSDANRCLTPNQRPAVLTAIRLWLPALVWMGLIFFLSAQPTLPGFHERWLNKLLSNGGHFGVYAVLALLCWRITRRGRWDGRVALAIAFVCAVLYGLSDECHQSFVPGRDPDVLDLAVDALGAAVALVLAAAVSNVRHE